MFFFRALVLVNWRYYFICCFCSCMVLYPIVLISEISGSYLPRHIDGILQKPLHFIQPDLGVLRIFNLHETWRHEHTKRIITVFSKHDGNYFSFIFNKHLVLWIPPACVTEHDEHTFTERGNFKESSSLTDMFLGGVRKPVNPEKTRANTGRTCKTKYKQ